MDASKTALAAGSANGFTVSSDAAITLFSANIHPFDDAITQKKKSLIHSTSPFSVSWIRTPECHSDSVHVNLRMVAGRVRGVSALSWVRHVPKEHWTALVVEACRGVGQCFATPPTGFAVWDFSLKYALIPWKEQLRDRQ